MYECGELATANIGHMLLIMHALLQYNKHKHTKKNIYLVFSVLYLSFFFSIERKKRLNEKQK